MKVTVYKDRKIARVWDCDLFEEIFECGEDVLMVEKDGIRTKACVLGDFGYGFWSYDVDCEVEG